MSQREPRLDQRESAFENTNLTPSQRRLLKTKDGPAYQLYLKSANKALLD